MHEDAAAYALGSLDAAELAEFEAHLATCEFCQQEVAEFSRTAAELSLLTQATPSPRLRPNVLAVTQRLPQLAAEDEVGERPDTPAFPSRGTSTDLLTRPAGPRRAMPGSWTPDEIPDEIPDELDSRRVDDLELRRQRRRSRILRGLVAAMLILAVGLGGVIYTLVQQRQAVVAERKAEVAQKTFEEQLLRAEDARMVVAPTLQGGGRCTFIVSRKLNRALYLGTNMPDPGQGRHYQLWTVTGTRSNNHPDLDNPVPNVRPWRQFFRGNVAKADFLAVSIEADGSTPVVPTSNKIIVLAPLT
jgi:anti-sigma factor RsiW